MRNTLRRTALVLVVLAGTAQLAHSQPAAIADTGRDTGTAVFHGAPGELPLRQQHAAWLHDQLRRDDRLPRHPGRRTCVPANAPAALGAAAATIWERPVVRTDIKERTHA